MHILIIYKNYIYIYIYIYIMSSKNDYIQFFYKYAVDVVKYPKINIINKQKVCTKIKTIIEKYIKDYNEDKEDSKCVLFLNTIIELIYNNYDNVKKQDVHIATQGKTDPSFIKKIPNDDIKKIPNDDIKKIPNDNMTKIPKIDKLKLDINYFSDLPQSIKDIFNENPRVSSIINCILLEIKLFNINPTDELTITVPSNREIQITKKNNVETLTVNYITKLRKFSSTIYTMLANYTVVTQIKEMLHTKKIIDDKEIIRTLVQTNIIAMQQNLIGENNLLTKKSKIENKYYVMILDVFDSNEKKNLTEYLNKINEIYSKKTIEYTIDDLELYLNIHNFFTTFLKKIINYIRKYKNIKIMVDPKLPLDDSLTSSASKKALASSTTQKYEYKPFDKINKTIYTVKFTEYDPADNDMQLYENSKYYNNNNKELTKIFKNYMKMDSVIDTTIILYIKDDMIYIDNKYQNFYQGKLKDGEICKFIINNPNADLINKSINAYNIIDEEKGDIQLDTDKYPFQFMFLIDPSEISLPDIDTKHKFFVNNTTNFNATTEYYISNIHANKKFNDACKENDKLCYKNKTHILNLMKTKINQDITEDKFYVFANSIYVSNDIILPSDKKYILIFNSPVNFYKDDISTYKGTYDIQINDINQIKSTTNPQPQAQAQAQGQPTTQPQAQPIAQPTTQDKQQNILNFTINFKPKDKYYINYVSPPKKFNDSCKSYPICSKNKTHILNLMKTKINQDITEDKFYVFANSIYVSNDIKLPSDKQYMLVFEKGIQFNFYNDDISIHNGKYKITSFEPKK